MSIKFNEDLAEAILKNISGAETLKLDSCYGNQSIEDSKHVFSCIDYSCFEEYGINTKFVITAETAVQVYEIVKDSTFAQMLGSLSTDLNTLCFTQSQILSFIAKYRGMLRTGCFYSTFFLFKSNENFFVACVYFVGDDSLGVNVHRFEDGNVWRSSHRHRVVVPQLTTL